MSVRERLLVVDDDPAIRRVLNIAFNNAGYCVTQATCGEEALRLIAAVDFDLALLDINLPGMSGCAVCRELRGRDSLLPIIMLSARSSQEDKVGAFSFGADDYVTKPFAMAELIARIQALLWRSRRCMHTAAASSERLQLDAHELLALCNGKKIKLTPIQFRILDRLVIAQGKTVPHRMLLSSVWGSDCHDRIEYIRVFIRQLRLLLEDDPTNPTVLQTVQGVGYKLIAVAGGNSAYVSRELHGQESSTAASCL